MKYFEADTPVTNTSNDFLVVIGYDSASVLNFSDYLQVFNATTNKIAASAGFRQQTIVWSFTGGTGTTMNINGQTANETIQIPSVIQRLVIPIGYTLQSALGRTYRVQFAQGPDTEVLELLKG